LELLDDGRKDSAHVAPVRITAVWHVFARIGKLSRSFTATGVILLQPTYGRPWQIMKRADNALTISNGAFICQLTASITLDAARRNFAASNSAATLGGTIPPESLNVSFIAH
jgi:hypothetical protein